MERQAEVWSASVRAAPTARPRASLAMSTPGAPARRTDALHFDQTPQP